MKTCEEKADSATLRKARDSYLQSDAQFFELGRSAGQRLSGIEAAADRAVELSQSTFQVARLAGERATQVGEAIASVASVSQQAAAGAEQMSASMEEIAASAEQVSAAVQEQTANVEEVSAMADELDRIAAQVIDLTSRFQTETRATPKLRLAA